MNNEKLLIKYILESIEHSKNESFTKKFKKFKSNLSSIFNSPSDIFFKEKEYKSPPKVFEKKYNVTGLSQEHVFPNNMSNKDFEKNILGWGIKDTGDFQFNLEKEHSKLNSLSKRDFKFILDNNPFINDLLTKLNFKSQSYDIKCSIVFNILMGMTSCFNESDIEFFLLIRRGNSKEHLSKEYKTLENNIEKIIGSGFGWFPSIDTMKYIHSQLSKGSYN